jgi:hypothetical protein
MSVNNRARVTYAAATPAVRHVSGVRQKPATISDKLRAQHRVTSLSSRVCGANKTLLAMAETIRPRKVPRRLVRKPHAAP